MAEALLLSGEILKNIELNEISLESIALKTGRLSRLLNDFTTQKIIEYEVAGYPEPVAGLPPAIYNLAIIAGREYESEVEETNANTSIKENVIKKYIYLHSISRKLLPRGYKLYPGCNYSAGKKISSLL